MAILWFYQDQASGTRYEVRSAGSSIRLYTNGAFHSQYSPKHLFTGGVWDLLGIAPLLDSFYQGATSRVKKILMLGVGGGAAMHQHNHLIQPTQITGIEFDPVHIQVARDYFHLNADNITLIEADAFDWVRSNRLKYDVVVDDLFIDAPGDPVRPFLINENWLNQLCKKLSGRGVLVQNHLSGFAAKQVAEELRPHFASALLLTVPQYENVVLAMYKQPVVAKSAKPLLYGWLRSIDQAAARKLKFSARQIF